MLGAPSERWYVARLRDGRLPGRKVGRNWRLTDQDIVDALDILKNDPQIADAPSGLTSRSKRRVAEEREGGTRPRPTAPLPAVEVTR
jgi:hypothetical protein